MNKSFKKVGACLRLTWVWTLLLVLCAVLSVWFVGPLLAVDDHRFWESPSARLLSISMLFLAWGLAMVFVAGRGAVQQPLAEDNKKQIGEERDRVRADFKEALHTLKTSSLYRGRSERWRDELPWYLLIGPQGAGKTSFLEFSGLQFPLNTIERERLRKADSANHCEWYFADHGVLIDTPGRYLTQASALKDASAWRTLLDLLHKRRRDRPLNGILVVIPAQELLVPDTSMIHAQAEQVRARLQEVKQALHVDVPIYLVLSKTDRLPGFAAFFERLSREESAQVLGTSFGKEENGSDKVVLRSALEQLLERLNSQVIMRIHQERDRHLRGQILDFPSQLARTGEGIDRFVEKAFASTRYLRDSQLRGVYLTSATSLQEQASAIVDDNPYIGSYTDALPAAKPDRAYFIEHLLSRVIFPEADLAGLDKRERSRIHWRHRALYAGALLTLACMAVLWTGGFSANYERLEKLRDLAQNWTRERSLLASGDDAMTALKTLDTRYAATRVFPDAGDASYRERTGLYQGDEVAPVVRAAYERELEEQLLPRVAMLLEAQIRDSFKDRERLLDSLRAYLMLNMQDHRDTQWLKDWVGSEWSRLHEGNKAVQDGLNGHFGRLLERPFIQPLNEPLVAQARQVLRSEPLANMVYRMLREQARDLPLYRLSQHLGPNASLFTGADYAIPGFYTRDGYQRYFSIQGALLLPQILRDNWVMGEGAQVSGMDLKRLKVELEQLYFRDYANHWGEAVGQMKLPAINDFGDGAQQLAGLTSAHSPILQLLVQVRENTRFPTLADAVEGAAGTAGNLSGALPVPDKAGSLGQLVVAAAGKASGALADKLPDTARKSLQGRFEPLHRLLDDENGPAADLVPALAALNDVQMQMDSLARATSPEQVAFDMARQRMAGQRDALSNLRNASGRLPRPVNAWFNVLAEDAWRLVLSDSYHYLNQRYQSELYSFYGKAISKRYPFNAHSASDVALNDFREFFKVQGIAERFFDNYMRPFVSGDPGNYRLRSVDGLSLPISRAYLDQMTTVSVIRQGFFDDDPAEPRVRFKLEPYTLDPAVSRSEFRLGDKSFEYRHGPIIPISLSWPVDAEDGRTSLVLDRMAGAPLGIEKNTGPWSLFRFVDLMQTEYLVGRDVLVLKANVGGLRANYLLTSQRMPNPFDMGMLRTFHMPVQL